jgi:hypothetical protein
MERFFGGNPALVIARLAIISLIVGVVLAALGFSPYDLVQTLRDLIQRMYDMGFATIEKGFRYFLLGAVIVFPIWFLMRVFKVLSRNDDAPSDDLVPTERNAPLATVATAAKESPKPSPAGGR